VSLVQLSTSQPSEGETMMTREAGGWVWIVKISYAPQPRPTFLAKLSREDLR